MAQLSTKVSASLGVLLLVALVYTATLWQTSESSEAGREVPELPSGIWLPAGARISRRLLATGARTQANSTTAGNSSIADTGIFPYHTVLAGYTPIIDGVERISGPGALAFITELSAILVNVTNSGVDTFGLKVAGNPAAQHPSTTPGLEAFQSFDIAFTLYTVTGASVEPFVSTETLSLGRPGILQAIKEAGLNATQMILWARELVDLNSPPLQAACSRILISGHNILPFTEDKQTMVMNILINVFSDASPPINSVNISAIVEAPTAPSGRRLQKAADDSTQGVYLDVWTVGGAQSAITPTKLYDLLNSTFLPTTTAAGLAMNLTYLNATVHQVKYNTILSTTYDPAVGTPLPGTADILDPTLLTPAAAAAPAAAAPAVQPISITAPAQAAQKSSSLSGGAIAGIAVGSAVALLAVLGLLAMLVARRNNKSAPKAMAFDKESSSDTAASSGSRLSGVPLLGRLLSKRSSTGGSKASSGKLVSQKSAHMSDGIPLPAPTSGIAMEIDPTEITLCIKDDGTPWLLGEGNFGQVYKGLRRGVQEVAVKKLTRTYDETLMKQIRKEIGILKRVSFDKHIVQFYGACLADPARAMLVMEYMGGGDLRQNLSAPDKQEQLAWSQHGKTIAMGIAQGLHFLHSSGVIHRDIKSSNILLTKEGVAKVADVGLATIVTADYFSWETAMGTFAYAAPELLMGERYTEKVDIYSFGVVLWEISTKEVPIRGKLRPLEVPQDCTAAMAELISNCLSSDPELRPSADEIYHRIKEMAF